MNVHLTEDDLRAIWRDIYQGVVRDSQYTITVPERAHQTAVKAADAYVAALRAGRKADDDALAAEVAARPPAEWARTADDERRDVLAHLHTSAPPTAPR